MRRALRTALALFLSIFYVRSGVAAQQAPLITADHTQTIYKHLIEKHWVPETGLFISFLGTQDQKLSQQSSTYEQAVIGLLALRMGDVERAQGIFKFFKTAWEEGPAISSREGVQGLANFYNAEFGGEGIEKTIHLGPNAWMGMFAARLGNTTGDAEATQWALSVAKWASKSLPHEKGGVAMGPVYGPEGIPWPQVYSTENNISYYAFLSELLRSTSLSAEDRVWLSSEKNGVEDWLVTAGFDRLAYAMNRGVNPQGADRTRALDTVTWLISAVGPKRLVQRGIDPDRLMRQAQQSFEVKVRGSLGVDATDQPEADLTFALKSEQVAPRRGSARPAEDKHRMIWYEGLGQYINTLNALADYYAKSAPVRSASYTKLALELTEEFDHAALPNARSKEAYPYATYGKFFHDGWYTPTDALDGPPSSLVSAAWRCFAGLGMDPLSGRAIAGVPTVQVTLPAIEEITHLRPSILYGTSEDMVVRAWNLLNDGDNDHAIQQAQATIQEWSPWALRLQEKKTLKVGRLIEYSGTAEQRQEIFGYWALNDVAAAYFVLGKAFDNKGHYAQASGAFKQIATRYPLAQIWDPRGWFWSPVDSIREDFVSASPRRYRNILPVMAGSPMGFGKQPF